MVGGACWSLEALHERLANNVFASDHLFADDTPVPVLDPGRGRTRARGRPTPMPLEIESSIAYRRRLAETVQSLAPKRSYSLAAVLFEILVCGDFGCGSSFGFFTA